MRWIVVFLGVLQLVVECKILKRKVTPIKAEDVNALLKTKLTVQVPHPIPQPIDFTAAFPHAQTSTNDLYLKPPNQVVIPLFRHPNIYNDDDQIREYIKASLTDEQQSLIQESILSQMNATPPPALNVVTRASYFDVLKSTLEYNQLLFLHLCPSKDIYESNSASHPKWPLRKEQFEASCKAKGITVDSFSLNAMYENSHITVKTAAPYASGNDFFRSDLSILRRLPHPKPKVNW